MRRLSLPRRRKRNRLSRMVEKTALRILALAGVARLIVRRGRLVFR